MLTAVQDIIQSTPPGLRPFVVGGMFWAVIFLTLLIRVFCEVFRK